MRPYRFENTIRFTCQVGGRGYWSGQNVNLTFRPAPPATGVRFIRTDLPGKPWVPALAAYRTEAQLRTRLVRGSAMVEMVEHVLAALYAMQIDNVFIDCDGTEMPALDGSCFPIVCALQQAGREVQPKYRYQQVIDRPIRIGSGSQWIAASPSTDSGLFVEYRLDYGPSSSIRPATFGFEVTPESFISEVAPARTFITQGEADMLHAKGLAKHVTYQDLLVFGPEGPIDNSLRYHDECARHKALDMIGDLALSGIDISGRVVACRSGHNHNGQLAESLCAQALGSLCRTKAA